MTERSNEHFSEESHPVSITEEQRVVGVRTKDIFDSQIKRSTPWLTKDNSIFILKPQKDTFQIGSNGDVPRQMIVDQISGEALRQEKISDRLAEVIFTFKRIEDKLPDFTGRSADLFRNYWGINNSYHQWSKEENEHSNAAELILVNTKHMSKEEVIDDYLENLSKTWELPFDTPRRMVLYAYFQEMLTNMNYVAVAKHAEKEDASTVGRIMRLIAKDEAYHAGGYRQFAQVFYEYNPQGTIDDVCYVALNFRMPAMHLMRDQDKDTLNIMKVGAFNKKMVSDQTIHRGLKNLGFVPDDLCRQVSEDYWPHQKQIAPQFVA